MRSNSIGIRVSARLMSGGGFRIRCEPSRMGSCRIHVCREARVVGRSGVRIRCDASLMGRGCFGLCSVVFGMRLIRLLLGATMFRCGMVRLLLRPLRLGLCSDRFLVRGVGFLF